MGEISLTGEQKKALEHLDRDIFISAGAGSGKTLVLTEMYMKALEERSIGEIAAITFTEKAAGTMLKRIRDKLHEKAASAAQRDAREKWISSKWDFDGAAISTIHGFCSRLLRDNPAEAQIDPDYTVIDEAQRRLLFEKVCSEFILGKLDHGDTRLLELISEYGIRRLKELFATATEKGIEFLETASTAAQAAEETVLARWARALERYQLAEANKLMTDEGWSSLIEALSSFRSLSETDRAEIKRRGLIDTHRSFHASSEPSEKLSFARRFKDILAIQGGKRENWPGDELERLRKIFSELSKNYGKLADILGLSLGEADQKALSILKQFSILATELWARFSDHKMAAGYLDFNDLLFKARSLLLNRPEVLERYGSKLKHLLVDEFQDIDQVQKEIIYLIGRRSSSPFTVSQKEPRSRTLLFCVGDAKQSIYRFRGADVKIINEALKKAAPSWGALRLALVENFRSKPNIIHFVNLLFSRLMATGDGSYEPIYEELKPKSGVDGRGEVELLLIDGRRADFGSEELRKAEASLIAQKIFEITHCDLNEEDCALRPKSGANRLKPYSCKDIAILLRDMAHVGIYEKALEMASIPHFTSSGSGFYQSQEVIDVLNFLKVMENGLDEVALAGLLRSPIFSISDRTIFWLTREGAIYYGFEKFKAIAQIEPKERDRLGFAWEVVSRLKRLKDRLSIPALIRLIMKESGYDCFLTGQFMGAQKLANIDKLAELGRKASSSSRFTLRDFIGQLDYLAAAEPKEGPAQVDIEKGDAVRVMTIHKAKGLEFPVVFLADISKERRSNLPHLLIEEELGPVLRPSTGQAAIWSVMAKEERKREIAESKRILYVALTRAMDRLYLCGSMAEQPDGEKELWASARWLDWLFAAFKPFDDEGRIKDELQVNPMIDPIRITAVEPLKVETSALAKAKDIEARISPGREPSVEANKEVILRAFARAAPLKAKQIFAPLSVRDIMTYKECPKLFELCASGGVAELMDALEVLDENGSPKAFGARLGVAAHILMQRIEQIDQADLARLIEDSIHEAGLTATCHMAAARKELQGMAHNFLSSPLRSELNGAASALSEAPFGVRFQGFIIEGRIDKLFLDRRGRWKVLDFKTDAVSPGEAGGHHYQWQVGLYAWAAKKMLGEISDCAIIYFLRQNRTVSVDTSAERIENIERGIKACLDGIASGHFPRSIERCPACRYLKICSSSAKEDN